MKKKVYFTVVFFFLLTTSAHAITALPEPTSMSLLALGLVGLAAVWKIFKK